MNIRNFECQNANQTAAYLLKFPAAQRTWSCRSCIFNR